MVSARAKSAAPPRSKIRDDRKFHSYTSKDNSTVFFATRPLVRTQVPVSTLSTAGNVHVSDAGTSSSSCSRRRPSYFAKMRKNYVPAAAASGSTANSTNSNKPTSTTRVAHLLSHEHLRVKKAKAIIGRPPPPVLSSKTSGGCDAAAAKPPPRIVQLSASPDVDEPAGGKLKTANASDPEIAAELRITSPAYEGDASLQLSHLQYSAFHNRYRCGSVDRAKKDPARPQPPQAQVDVDQDTAGAGVIAMKNNTKIIPGCVDDKCLQLDRALGRAATSAAKRVWGDDEDRNGNGAAADEVGEVEGGCGSAPASCMKRVDAALDQAAVSAEAAVWGGGSSSSCMQRVDAALDRVAVAAETAVWGTTIEATRVEPDVATKTEQKESASSEPGDQWQRVNASGLTTTTSTTSCFENMSSRILTNLSSPCRGGARASGGPATTTSEEVEVESNLESDRLSSKASSTVSGMLAKLSAGPPKMAWTDDTTAGYSGLSRGGGGVFLTTNEAEDEGDDIQCGSGLRDRDPTTAISGKPDEEGASASTAKSPRGASPEDSSPYVARTKANGPKNTRTVLVPAYVPSPHQPRSPRTSPPSSSPTNKGKSTAKTMKSSAAPSHSHQQQLHEQEPSRGKSPLITSQNKAAASSATSTSIGMQPDPDASRKMSRVEQIMELRSAGGKTSYLADVMLQRSAARNRLPSPLLREPATTNGGLFHFHDGRIKQWSPSSRSPAREQLVSSPASEHWSVSQVSSGAGQQLSAADGKRKAMPMRGGSHQQERHCQSARGLNPNDWWGDYEGISNGPLRVGLRQAEWTRRREEKKLRLSEDLIDEQCTPSDDFIAHQSRSSAGRYRYISPRVYDEKRKGGFLRNAISASPNPKSRAGRSSGKSSSRKLELEVKIRNGTCLYARGKAAMDQKEFRRSTLLAERALLETSSCTFQPDIFVSQLHEKERENAKILARAVRNWKTAKGGGTGVGSSVSRSASANASFREQGQQINISAATEISRRSGAGAGDDHLTRAVSLNMARQPGTPLVIPAVPTVAMADARSSSTPFFSAQSTLSTSSTKGALRVVSPSLKTSDAPAKLPGSSGGPSTAKTRPTDTTATLSTGKSFSFYPGSRNASVPVTDRSAGTTSTSASFATTDGGLAGAKTKTQRLVAGPTSSGPVATPRGARAVQIFRDQRNALIKPISGDGGGSFACRINLAEGGAAGAGDTVVRVRTSGATGMGNKKGTGTSSCSDKKTKTRAFSSSTARSDSLAFVSAHSATADATATDAGGSGASASTSHGRNQDASVVKHDHQESLRESHEVLTKLKSLLVAKPRPTLTTSSSSSRMGGSSSFASTSHQFWTPQERRSASQQMRNSSRGTQRASVQRSARSASPLPRHQQELTADNLPHFATPIKRTPRARIASEAEAVVVQRKARPARGAGGGRRKKKKSAEHQEQNEAQADTEKADEKGRAHAKEESVADTAAGAAAGASQRQSQDRPRSSRGPRRGEDTDTMLGKMLEIFDSPWRKTNAAGGTAEAGGPSRAGRASGSGRPITALFFSDPPTTTTRASGSAGAADGKNKKKKVAASARLHAAPTLSIYVSPAESALHAGSTATSSSAKMANTLVLDGCCEANEPDPRRNCSEPEDGRGDVMSYQDTRAIAAQHHVWVPSTSAELLYSNRSGAELQVNMNTATLSTTGNTSRSGSGAPMKRSPSPPSVQEILGESIDDIEERISRRSSLNMPNNGGSFEQENSVD